MEPITTGSVAPEPAMAEVKSSDLLDAFPCYEIPCPEDLVTELRNTKLMLIAAILSNGGKLTIKDECFHEARSDKTIHRYNDCKNGQVIFSV